MSAAASHVKEMIEKTEVSRLGFWLFILSDVMIFGALFATYMILRGNTAGGVSGADIFEAPYVLLQTMALLISSFTAAMALLAANNNRLAQMKQYLFATLIFGLTFFGLEINEFVNLVADGHSWQSSAFLSIFFTLVGTHGFHIATGLIWLGVWLYFYKQRGLDDDMKRKLGLFVLFWHFLDLIWIWIFTVVYMFGVGL